MFDHNKFMITLKYMADLCNSLILMLINVMHFVIGLGLTRLFFIKHAFLTLVYRSVRVTKEWMIRLCIVVCTILPTQVVSYNYASVSKRLLSMKPFQNLYKFCAFSAYDM